ncbi:hypothetical protein SAMN06265371_102363 [Lutibacter agarilyticus]|uniref:WD40-like Beta Propeller Repeat n=1 Tax=Lutibacter agarilyticus TaxID=1109740 RepID=A0A238W3G3_9FLAO|nr:hypothetical protein [Lutibacter agarilyticus]SNR40703.1 hypothetical protein SAMN06265371_102363 [Lutibacter agarilyticus]
MKLTYTCIIALFFVFITKAQERYLIEETDSIQLFETYLSNTSVGNVFPTIYKNGLIYVSDYKAETYRLYYSDLQSKSKKINLGARFDFGAASTFKNEIYFTGISKTKDSTGYYNSTIYKGIIEDQKVSGIESLSFCNKNYSYTDPCISKNGNHLIVVSTERKTIHIMEYAKNDLGKWIKKGVVYISHPDFDIINPTYFNENTIYFSSNLSTNKDRPVNYTVIKAGKDYITKAVRGAGDFNIFKIERIDGRWSYPKKANEFNSEFDELGVVFDSEKSGYLTSFRYNSNDNIYYFKLKQ